MKLSIDILKYIHDPKMRPNPGEQQFLWGCIGCGGIWRLCGDHDSEWSTIEWHMLRSCARVICSNSWSGDNADPGY